VSSYLKLFVMVAALLGGNAARADACDARGYDAEHEAPRAGSCSTIFTWRPAPAIDYEAPTFDIAPGAREHAARNGGEKADKSAPLDETKAESLRTIWTAA
jgi:hypothetical protein